MTKPVSPQPAPRFGVMVRRSENAREDPGLVSGGHGDHGGRSYGLYQLSSRRPRPGEPSPVEGFVETSGYGPYFAGTEPNSDRYIHRWRDLAREPRFVEAQHDYMQREYYQAIAERLERSGLALKTRGQGVRELMFSTAVQYGPGLGHRVVTRALRGRDPASLSDEDLIVALQDDKLANVDRDFSRSSQAVRQGVRNRIRRERETALQMGRGPVVP